MSAAAEPGLPPPPRHIRPPDSGRAPRDWSPTWLSSRDATGAGDDGVDAGGAANDVPEGLLGVLGIGALRGGRGGAIGAVAGADDEDDEAGSVPRDRGAARRPRRRDWRLLGRGRRGQGRPRRPGPSSGRGCPRDGAPSRMWATGSRPMRAPGANAATPPIGTTRPPPSSSCSGARGPSRALPRGTQGASVIASAPSSARTMGGGLGDDDDDNRPALSAVGAIGRRAHPPDDDFRSQDATGRGVARATRERRCSHSRRRWRQGWRPSRAASAAGRRHGTARSSATRPGTAAGDGTTPPRTRASRGGQARRTRAQGRRSRWFSRRAARERPRGTATVGAELASAVCSGSCRRPCARPAAEGPAARARGATALADGREEADKEADQKQRNDGHGGFCY